MNEEEIDPRTFDTLIEWISDAKTDVVIDSGASSFVALSHYLISSQVPQVLQGLGHQLVVHTLIAGGQTLVDTVSGFAQLVRQFPESCQFVVWLNPYWGPIARDGKQFEQMKAYTASKQRVAAIVRIPSVKAETFGLDIREMLEAHLSFDEALAHHAFSIMTRQRIKIFRDRLFAELERAQIL